MRERMRELLEELASVTKGRVRVLDALLPPLAYAVASPAWGLAIAIGVAVGVAGLIGCWRMLRRQPVGYALGGLGAAATAGGLALLTGRAEGYYLTGVIQGLALAGLSVMSVLLRRPLVALTSHVTRGWPLGWYWQPRVRPAYSEVTLAWGAWFAGRGLWLWGLYRRGAESALALTNTLTGWPATLLLLVLTYLYGLWRLGDLGGPSVPEYEAGADPPWQGQRRGF